MSGTTHTDDEQPETTDSLAPIREHEAAVEALAADTDRDDGLDAAARVLLALARDERPDSADLRTLGLSGRGDYQQGRYAPAGGLTSPPPRAAIGRLSRAVMDAL